MPPFSLENAIATVIAASLDAEAHVLSLETVQVGRPPVQSYRPAPGHSTASESSGNDDGRTCHVLEFLRRQRNGEEREIQPGKVGRASASVLSTMWTGILNRVRNRYSRSDRSVLSQFPPHSLGFPRPRQLRSSILLSLVVATAKRCLSVHNGHTGNFTLFAFKKSPFGPFSRQVIRTDPFQY